VAVSFRYFRRHWDQSPYEHDDWGGSIWFFEVDDEGWPVRQIEVYENGPVLKYDRDHLDDEYGGLGDQPLDFAEFAQFEIASDVFEAAWGGA
jgi:hypothetical protein